MIALSFVKNRVTIKWRKPKKIGWKVRCRSFLVVVSNTEKFSCIIIYCLFRFSVFLVQEENMHLKNELITLRNELEV